MPDKEVAEPQKYRRREVLSNWSRYEERPDEPEEGEDYLIGDDFSQILEQQGKDSDFYLMCLKKYGFSCMLIHVCMLICHFVELLNFLYAVRIYISACLFAITPICMCS